MLCCLCEASHGPSGLLPRKSSAWNLATLQGNARAPFPHRGTLSTKDAHQINRPLYEEDDDDFDDSSISDARRFPFIFNATIAANPLLL